MWDEMKQQQLDELQRRESEGALTDEEQRRLEQLLYELEQEEWQTLRPSLERLREERTEIATNVGHTQMQNALSAAIAARQDDFLKRAKAQLAALQSESKELKAECERVLG